MGIGKSLGWSAAACLALALVAVKSSPVSAQGATAQSAAIACVSARPLITASAFKVSGERLFYIKNGFVYRRDTLDGGETEMRVDGDTFNPSQVFALKSGAVIASTFAQRAGENQATTFWMSADGVSYFEAVSGGQILDLVGFAEGEDVLAMAGRNGVYQLNRDGLTQLDPAGDVTSLIYHKGTLYAGRPDGLYRFNGSGLVRVDSGRDGVATGLFELDGRLFFLNYGGDRVPSLATLDDATARIFLVKGFPPEGAKGAFGTHYLALGSQLLEFNTSAMRFITVFDARVDANAMHIQSGAPVSVFQQGDRVFVSYADISGKSGHVLEWNAGTKKARVLPQPARVIETIFAWKNQLLFANVQHDMGALFGAETKPWEEAEVIIANESGFSNLRPRTAKPTQVDFRVTHPCAASMQDMVVKVSATSAEQSLEDLATGHAARTNVAGQQAREFSSQLPMNYTGKWTFKLAFPSGTPAIGPEIETRFGPLISISGNDSRIAPIARALVPVAALMFVVMPGLFVAARWSPACQRVMAMPILSKLIWPAYLPRFSRGAQNWLLESYFATRRRRERKRGGRIQPGADLVVAGPEGTPESGSALIIKLARERRIWIEGSAGALAHEWRRAYFADKISTMAEARKQFGFAAIFVETSRYSKIKSNKARPEHWLVEAAVLALGDSKCFIEPDTLESMMRGDDIALVVEGGEGREKEIAATAKAFPRLRLLVTANAPAPEGFARVRLG